MTATEKVEAGIRCCISPMERCSECPYREKAKDIDFEECRIALRREAIAEIERLKLLGKRM